MATTSQISRNAFGALRALAADRRPESCDFCGIRLEAEHSHLLEIAVQRILCACPACAILLNHRGERGRFSVIPKQVVDLRDFEISDTQWTALRLPIDLAFFVQSTPAGRVVAFYPSPAGCTESLLNLDAWDEIVRNNAVLGCMQSDVEALLVNHTRGNRQCFIAPIDDCYRLTGLIRRSWRGLSGGEELWLEVTRFFDGLRERALSPQEPASA